jgi:hypothetical protein
MKQCKKNTTGWIGLIGLTITVALNLVALLLWKKASAEYFSDKWWSEWFPLYIFWLGFAIISFTGCFRRKTVDTKHDA